MKQVEIPVNQKIIHESTGGKSIEPVRGGVLAGVGDINAENGVTAVVGIVQAAQE